MRKRPRTPKQLVDLYFLYCNEQRLDELPQLFADEFVSHLRIGDVRTPERYREVMVLMLRAFPDARWYVDELITTKDRATVRYHFEGTHRDDLFGIPATNRFIRAEGLELVHVTNGTIVEIWNYTDLMGLAAQLHAPNPFVLAV